MTQYIIHIQVPELFREVSSKPPVDLNMNYILGHTFILACIYILCLIIDWLYRNTISFTTYYIISTTMSPNIVLYPVYGTLILD
jgi:hypothetical protein